VGFEVRFFAFENLSNGRYRTPSGLHGACSGVVARWATRSKLPIRTPPSGQTNFLLASSNEPI